MNKGCLIFCKGDINKTKRCHRKYVLPQICPPPNMSSPKYVLPQICPLPNMSSPKYLLHNHYLPVNNDPY